MDGMWTSFFWIGSCYCILGKECEIALVLSYMSTPSSHQMHLHGELCKDCFRNFVTTLGQNGTSLKPVATHPKARPCRRCRHRLMNYLAVPRRSTGQTVHPLRSSSGTSSGVAGTRPANLPGGYTSGPQSVFQATIFDYRDLTATKGERRLGGAHEARDGRWHGTRCPSLLLYMSLLTVYLAVRGCVLCKFDDLTHCKCRSMRARVYNMPQGMHIHMPQGMHIHQNHLRSPQRLLPTRTSITTANPNGRN